MWKEKTGKVVLQTVIMIFFFSTDYAVAQIDTDLSSGGGARIGWSNSACDPTVSGAIRYNSGAGGSVDFCHGGVWKNIGGAAAAAASPDRGIQFNSGGSFFADPNFIYTTNGSIGLGTVSPSYTISLSGTGAARSIGMEIETTASTAGRDLNIYAGGASGGSNRAGGNLILNTGRATGHGIASVSFYTVMPGQGSGSTVRNPSLSMTVSSNALKLPGGTTAQRPGAANMQAAGNGMIRYNTSNNKFEAYENGGWIDMIGGATTILGTSATANNPRISGDAASGFFTPAAATVGVATGGVEALRVASDQRVGIGQAAPQAKLDVNGGVRIGNNANPCLAANTGELIWNGTNIQVCNGINWTTLGTPACGMIANPVVYTAQDNIPVSTQVDSNPALIGGLGCSSVNVSVVGPGAPEYRLCADLACSSVLQGWGVTLGNVQNGQYVQLRQTSNAAPATTNTATLTVGATNATWLVTTEGPKTMFITSTTYAGALGGLSGADNKCQLRAAAASLPGTYKAWLSDTTTSAASRLAHSTLGYKNTQNQTVQIDWINLAGGGNLINAIAYDEFGVYVPNFAWTNTDGSGGILQTTSTDTCNNWTVNSSSYYGRAGDTNAIDTRWTDYGVDSCNEVYHLICIQQ